MIVRPRHVSVAVLPLLFFGGCGEPVFENAGSPHSLLEDREACAVEIEQSPAAMDYRENPTAHPEYPSQVFEEMNRCIEQKGWRQVRSQYEQEQLRNAVLSEAARTGAPGSVSDSAATKSFVQGVENRLAQASGAGQREVKKN